MDELDRIERTYGCVAEYYRCMYEEGEAYEPSEEELLNSEADHRIFQEKIRILNGTPSQPAVSLKADWDKKKPAPSDPNSWTMSDVYAWREYNKARLFATTEELCRHYGVTRDETMSLYGSPAGTFATGVEYHDDCYIKSWDITGLDYETFKSLFRDLYELGFSPTMAYSGMDGKNRIYSNCSLGRLRISELRWLGFETEEGLEKELSEAGFNEARYREQITGALRSEYQRKEVV